MWRMRDLTDEFKLSARSTPEVFLLLGQMVDRLKADRRVRFRGKKPTRAALVNAALLYLDTLPQAEWEKALQVGLTRLERILAEDEPTAATGTESAEAPAAAVAAPEAAPAPARRAAPRQAATPARAVDLTVADVSPEPAAAKPAGRRKRNG